MDSLTAVLLIVLILNTMLAVIEAFVLIWRRDDGRNNPMQALPDTTLVQSPGDYGDRVIEIVNICTGEHLTKWFHGSLILGRTISQQEYPNRLYLGNVQSISRNQCCILESPVGLVVQNMSHVNVTLHNGMSADSPQPILPGDYLDIGGARYLIANLS